MEGTGSCAVQSQRRKRDRNTMMMMVIMAPNTVRIHGVIQNSNVVAARI